MENIIHVIDDLRAGERERRDGEILLERKMGSDRMTEREKG